MMLNYTDSLNGSTENARHETTAQSKCRGRNCEKGNSGTKMQGWKLRETETVAQCCRGVENAAQASMDSQKNT